MEIASTIQNNKFKREVYTSHPEHGKCAIQAQQEDEPHGRILPPAFTGAGSVRQGLELSRFGQRCFFLGGSYILYPGLGITKGPVKLAAAVQYQKMKGLNINKDGVTGVSWVDQESYTVKGKAVTMGASMIVSWK